jgi:Rps23 Pro-64 3,4-dihydroxylase Tpa1-like proline 4-hydroxylase
MINYQTKYFGELAVDEESDFEYFDLSYNDNPMYISMSGFNGEKDKIEKCMEIIDRYAEIDETARKAIMENFPGNEIIRYYFKFHFDHLDKEKLEELFGVSDINNLSVENAAKELEYPDLVFSQEFEEIQLTVDYRVSKEFSDEVLCVLMNEDLFILDFAREN